MILAPVANVPIGVVPGYHLVNALVITNLALYALSNLPVASAFRPITATKCLEICAKTVEVRARAICFLGCIAVDLGKAFVENLDLAKVAANAAAGA
jgi:hypothetical protein